MPLTAAIEPCGAWSVDSDVFSPYSCSYSGFGQRHHTLSTRCPGNSQHVRSVAG